MQQNNIEIKRCYQYIKVFLKKEFLKVIVIAIAIAIVIWKFEQY